MRCAPLYLVEQTTESIGVSFMDDTDVVPCRHIFSSIANQVTRLGDLQVHPVLGVPAVIMLCRALEILGKLLPCRGRATTES